MRRAPRTLAVALHDIEPATFDHCALIRDWLSDHGVERVTLLVIPARDLHPLSDRSPEMAAWLHECELRGDAIAQHGFRHLHSGRVSPLARLRRDEAEFVGLGRDDTRRAVDAGLRVLKLAGIEPRGFVAPAYAYPPALREILGVRFDWWTSLLRLHCGGASDRRRLGPPLRTLSPVLLGIGARTAGRTLRLDLHPSDLSARRRMLALESLLRRSAGRTAITYDELAAGAA
jgi:predicted deacetylase